jgi:hypothetical protein
MKGKIHWSDLPNVKKIKILAWLVVWNMNFIFPYIGNVIIPTDELHHFSEG